MPGKRLKIACVGEAMIEMSSVVMPGTCKLGVAGDALNTAIYLRRALPEPHEVHFISAVGQDPLSEQMLSYIEEEGVRTDHVGRSGSRGPGLYAISTDSAGERTFQYWRSNSAARTLFQDESQVGFDTLNRFDLVHVTAISMAILPAEIRQGFMAWAKSYRTLGGRISFDSNYRPALWEDAGTARRCVDDIWKICDIALPSLDDELAMFGDADKAAVLKRFETYKDCIGALKCGARGPVPINARIDTGVHFPMTAAVVDTTAAGDSFAGGFLGAHLSGASLADAMATGHRFASDVIQHRGAIVPRSAHGQRLMVE